jgi:short subunit dehydrogenase-like uncharacterized protein
MEILLYGSYGYTGTLIVDLLKKENIKVTLSGRNEEKLKKQAESVDMNFIPLSLNEKGNLESVLKKFDVIVNCAGPFIHTVDIVIEACLKTKTHYIDITGEIEVFEKLRWRDAQAKENEIFMLPGAGFDVVPTDCLATFLLNQLPDASFLEMGFMSNSGLSRGTALTMSESIHKGGAIRKEGKIKSVPIAYSSRTIEKEGKSFSFMSIPWGDVSTAYHSTGIPNVILYAGAHPKTIAKMKRFNSFKSIFGWTWVKKIVNYYINKNIKGPSEELRNKSRVWVWGEVRNDTGKTVFAELDTPEGYQLTASSVVTIIKKLEMKPLDPGFYTPSRAFGADYILEFTDSKRDIR